MSYKTYGEYRESGVDWISSIPSNWNIIRLKFLTDIVTGSTPSKIDDTYYKDGTFPWVKPDDLNGLTPITKTNVSINDKGKKISRIIPKDSVLVCCIGSLGKIGVAGTELATNQQINSLIPNKLLNNDFCKYMVIASNSEYAKYSNSNVVAIINKQQQGELKYPIPPLKEQKQIANYLNKKTTKIDSTIDKSEELVKLLEEKRIALINQVVTKGLNSDVAMKDSGIEWIGEIPEHWNIDKIKKYFRIYNGSTPKDKEENWFGDICWVTPADYKTNDVYINDSARQITKIGLNSCGTTLVPKGSIIVSNRAPIGSVAIANVDLCTNQGCKSLVRKKDINSKFVYYILSVNEKELNKLGRGTTFMELSSYDLGTFKIPIASSSEQNDIVSFLDKEISKINKTSSKIKENITLLKEYKTSLIHHVVTGKIDVRDEEI